MEDPGKTEAAERGEKMPTALDTEIDSGVGSVSDGFEEVGQLKQGLQQRHIQFIALAGTIGTGLFLGSGQAIAEAGPLGALLGYTIIGIAASSVVLAVAEMGTLVPLSGGIVRYAEIFVDPALSFADGWNLVYDYFVSIPAEIVAAAVLIEYWVTVNNAIWITVFGIIMICSSIVFIRVYGELEFSFSILKILLILIVNIMSLVITCGGGPNHEAIGFRYWRNPGPFVQYMGIAGSLGQFLGFWTTFNNALYAYSGVETITMAAAELQNPRRSIPRAARRIFWRILLFYVISIFMIGLIVPSNDPNLLNGSGAAESPFVIAANLAGIGVIPHIINAIVITSAWSSGNSSMLNGSRTLFGLARNGRAPSVFARLNRFGVPYVAVGLFGAGIALAYMTLSNGAATVFTWLQALVAISTLTNWIVILITYLRFYYGCRAQGIDRHASLPWAAPLQPYAAWFSLGLFILLLLTSGYTTFMTGDWDTETFVSSYFNIPFMAILYFGYKIFAKTKVIPLREIPIRPYIAIAEAHPEPPEKPKKGLQRLNILWS